MNLSIFECDCHSCLRPGSGSDKMVRDTLANCFLLPVNMEMVVPQLLLKEIIEPRQHVSGFFSSFVLFSGGNLTIVFFFFPVLDYTVTKHPLPFSIQDLLFRKESLCSFGPRADKQCSDSQILLYEARSDLGPFHSAQRLHCYSSTMQSAGSPGLEDF